MAVNQLADRIQETTTVTGTGTATLLGAVTGFRPFSTFADGDTTYYVIVAVNGSGVPTGEWEVGRGTVGGVGTTLARTTVLSSSNAGALVNFAAGTKNVLNDQPSSVSMEMATATTQVLFNNAGAIGGSAAFTWTSDGLLATRRAAFGSDASFATDYKVVAVDHTAATLSAAQTGIGLWVKLTANPPSSSGHFYYGAIMGVATAAGNPYNLTPHGLVGYLSTAYHQGSGAIDELVGNNVDVEMYGAPGQTAGTMRGFDVYMYNEGTATTASGFHIGIDNSGGGNWGVLRGIAIDDMAGFTASNIHPINYADKFIVDGAGVAKAAGYQSSDGSAGVTGGPFTSVTVKNGLVVAGT